MRLFEHAGARSVLAAGLALFTMLTGARSTAHQPEPAAEVRALWVTRNSLQDAKAVARMVSAAQQGGFNAIVMQVRARGDAYYRSSFEPQPAELTGKRAFDPLADAIALARAAGLQVHAWVAVNLVSSAVDLPKSPQHIIHRQPDWLMVPKALAPSLNRIDPKNPEYVGRLARWTRARRDEVEGLYSSPIHPWAATHVTEVITELARSYDLDGIHLDYVRFPNDEFDYSKAAIQQFKRTLLPQLTAADRREADARERTDPLAYPEMFQDRWTEFRKSRLTELVARVHAAVKAVRPDIVLSAAVIPEHTHASDSRLQDWRSWLAQSLLDVVCPMAYVPDVSVFERQISDAQGVASGARVWAGIGAYKLTASGTRAHIAAARRLKTGGVILFSYDSLVAPPNSVESLVDLGRAAFASDSRQP